MAKKKVELAAEERVVQLCALPPDRGRKRHLFCLTNNGQIRYADVSWPRHGVEPGRALIATDMLTEREPFDAPQHLSIWEMITAEPSSWHHAWPHSVTSDKRCSELSVPRAMQHYRSGERFLAWCPAVDLAGGWALIDDGELRDVRTHGYQIIHAGTGLRFAFLAGAPNAHRALAMLARRVPNALAGVAFGDFVGAKSHPDHRLLSELKYKV